MSASAQDIAKGRLNRAANVNVKSKDLSNVNVNVIKIQEKDRKSRAVRRLAQLLVDKLGDEKDFLYYCKVAWSLPQAQVMQYLELAQAKGKNPRRYFTWLCKRAMTD